MRKKISKMVKLYSKMKYERVFGYYKTFLKKFSSSMNLLFGYLFSVYVVRFILEINAKVTLYLRKLSRKKEIPRKF